MSKRKQYFCPKHTNRVSNPYAIVNITKVKLAMTNNRVKVSCCCDGKDSACDNECSYIKDWLITLSVSSSKKTKK